jgi:NADPH2:quinone reductase
MKAAYIESTGAPEKIVFGSVTKPKPAGSQVLVKVKAVSVNPIDTYIRSGMIKADLPKPFIIGCDLAGVVESIGPDVKRFKPGDRVWGSNQGLFGRQGTFAEYAAVEEHWLYNTPEEVEDTDAAALALTGITAHLGCFRLANLKMGENVFVHGGAGGVGSCVIQMARAVGARVITTAGSQEKLQVCRQLGATVAVNYKTDDLAAALKKFGPIDLWWETIREPNFELALEHLNLRSRLIVMAGREARPTFPIGPFYTKDITMFGFAMFNSPPEEQRKCAAEMNRWMAKGRLKPLIGKKMKLAEAAAAHRLQEENTLKKAGTLLGKIVLTV